MSSSTALALDAATLAPYEAFFEGERAQMERVARSAAELANEAAVSTADGGDSPQLPRSRIPEDCFGPTANFLACAFSWSVSYTNELRRLQRDASSSTTSSPSSLLTSARLRMARPADVAHIMGFIRELAEFEREPEAVVTDERIMLRDGFTAGRQFQCVLCEVPRELHASIIAAAAAAATAAGGSDAATTTAAAAAAAQSSSIAATASSSASSSAAGVPSLPGPSSEWVPIAFGHVHSTYSTWEGRSMYIEDLYVQPPFRRQGLSGLFFACIARAADACGSARLQWSALDWNTPAINAYTGPAINAIHMKEWNIYRLYRDGIRRLSVLPVGEEEGRRKKETS
jgi:hypothetical protein